KRAKLLFRLVRYLQGEQLLELGTSLGIATQALQVEQPKASLTSIEGCQAISDTAKTYLKNTENIKLLVGDFETQLTALKQTHFDLIFFDGHHSKDATLRSFETVLPKAHNGSVFIVDDV